MFIDKNLYHLEHVKNHGEYLLKSNTVHGINVYNLSFKDMMADYIKDWLCITNLPNINPKVVYTNLWSNDNLQ